MSQQRQVQRQLKELVGWFIDRRHSAYGENEYLILAGMGTPEEAGFFYRYWATQTTNGGTGNHEKALREALQRSDTSAMKAADLRIQVGEQYWLVVGPAHDGQRRGIPIVTVTQYERILLIDRSKHNDSRGVAALRSEEKVEG